MLFFFFTVISSISSFPFFLAFYEFFSNDFSSCIYLFLMCLISYLLAASYSKLLMLTKVFFSLTAFAMWYQDFSYLQSIVYSFVWNARNAITIQVTRKRKYMLLSPPPLPPSVTTPTNGRGLLGGKVRTYSLFADILV